MMRAFYHFVCGAVHAFMVDFFGVMRSLAHAVFFSERRAHLCSVRACATPFVFQPSPEKKIYKKKGGEGLSVGAGG